jgi:DNA-binding transcriptional regulator YiaG
MTKFDFKTTKDKAPPYITKAFLARAMGCTWASVNNWYNGSVIPKGREKRLMEILQNNDVVLYFYTNL